MNTQERKLQVLAKAKEAHRLLRPNPPIGDQKACPRCEGGADVAYGALYCAYCHQWHQDQ